MCFAAAATTTATATAGSVWSSLLWSIISATTFSLAPSQAKVVVIKVTSGQKLSQYPFSAHLIKGCHHPSSPLLAVGVGKGTIYCMQSPSRWRCGP